MNEHARHTQVRIRRQGRRRKRFAAAGVGSALAVAVVAACAAPSLGRDPHQASGDVGSSTPITHESRPAPQLWATRGNATPAALAFARSAYAKVRKTSPGQVRLHLLWGGSPDNGPQVLLAAGNTANGPATAAELVVVYYAEDGVKQLIEHDPLPQDAREVNRIVNTGSGPYVVAVGEPGTSRLGYSASGGDSFAAQSVTAGVAAFARSGPTGTKPDALTYTLAGGDRLRVDVHTGSSEGQPTRG